MGQIEFRGLNFWYPGCEEPALSDITLSVEPSRFVLLCGRSGCGKSTFLRHLKRTLLLTEDMRARYYITGRKFPDLIVVSVQAK